MKKILTLLLTLPFLVGCKEPEYNGYKLKVEKDESGELTLADPNILYETAITNKKECVFYIGDDTCSACQKLKPQLEAWVKAFKGKIYYIPLESITTENVQKMYDATTDDTGYYQWGDDSSVPTTYFFSAGFVVFRGGSTDTMTLLNRYVTVEK